MSARVSKSGRQAIDEIVHLLGKRTDPNPYLLPNGSMRRAVNMWMTRAGLLSKRRGFTRWSNTLTRQVNKIFPYEGGFIAHVGAGTGPSPYGLVRVSSAGVATFYGNDGSWTPPSAGPGTGWRVRSAIAGKDMFLTSGDWVYRLSGSTGSNAGNFRKAGGLVAPSFDMASVTTILSGAPGTVLADGFCAAYRYVLGSTNNFQRQILGPVSGRVVITNQSGTSGWVTTVAKNVKVRCLLSPDAIVGDFISLYRSAQIAAGSTPDDDLQLVFQRYLDATDISNGYVEVTDVVPDALRGAFIYTSPNAGEGILQNNDQPPQCADLVLHKNRLFFMNCAQPPQYNLAILAVGGSSGIQDGDGLQILGSNSFTVTAKTSPSASNEYGLITSGSASFNIEQTALNLVAAINRYTSNTSVWARYVSGENDAPGKINIYMRTPAANTSFQVLASPGAQRDCFSPALLMANANVNLSRTSNVVTATATSGNLSLKIGESVSFGAASGSFGVGPFTVLSTPTAASITYAETGPNATLTNVFMSQVGGGSTPTNPITVSKQDVFPNRVYYSKFGQFDAVPGTNFFDVGAQESDIIAGLSTNDQLWLWKRDGIIRMVGDDPTTFAPIDVDRTVVCNARETIVKFLGAPVGLTDRGFVQATISGLEYLSQPIQKELLDQMVGTQATYLDQISFAVPYDSEGHLLLFFASGRDLSSGSGGLICQSGYVFSAKANDWTEWSWGSGDGDGRTCGAVLGGQLYFGDRYKTGTSSCFVYQERKARLASDYLDQLGDASTQVITSIVAPSVLTARNPGRSKLFSECALLFEGTQPSVLTVSDANEFGNGGTHTIVPTSGYASRFWPYINASAGRILLLSITHAVASEAFDLAGLQVSYMLEGLEAER
jgi:hypothetical protein